MKKLLNGYKRFIIDLIGIITFAVVIANISTKGFVSSISDLVPVGRELDFQSSDFYQIVADARAEKVLDDQIVIVPIDNLSRKEICHLIEDISLCSPRAIGLDVFFAFPMEGDDHLLEVLRTTQGLIAPMGVIPGENKQWKINDSYLLDSLYDNFRGIVNMNVKRRYHVVRGFVPCYQTDRGIINHFALVLASQANPSIAERLQTSFMDNPSQDIPIDYTSREFEIIEPEDVLESTDNLKNKVVMIGALHDTQDIFITPINDAMPGIMVHAYTLSTILGERYINAMPKWGLYLFGLLISILFVIVKMWLKRHSIENLLMRVFQVLIMLVIIYLGCLLFIEYYYVVELSMPLMLVALGLVALDIWDDFLRIIHYFFNYMKKFFLTKLHLLAFFLMLPSALQAVSFRIYRVEGEVSILKNNKWVTPTINQELSVSDQFMIGEQGRLGIVNNENHRIYYTVRNGKQNVAQIISAARKQSDRIASNMHKQLTSNTKLTDSPLPIWGGVNRGKQQNGDSTAFVYAAIYQYLQTQEKQASKLVSADIITSDDSYFFKAVNNTDMLLFANVIRLPQASDDYPQICLEVGYTMNEPFLVIGPHQETNWSNYTFLRENLQHNYLLFASETPYDCQALQMLLRTFSPPNQPNGKQAKVYFSLIK